MSVYGKLQVIQASVWSLDGDAYGTMVFCVYYTMYIVHAGRTLLYFSARYVPLHQFWLSNLITLLYLTKSTETTVDDEYALISTSYNRERKTENNKKREREK